MSIQELSQATRRVLGSTQVISDPSSVVKELIDNAIDARANAVSIEISANTLDIVQVRDNGHGVAPEDRDVICKRYCTSKIRDCTDLRNVGGSWLGFRGEALASAVEISGSLDVTTRVTGETCAVSLSMDRTGHVERSTTASHPIGTTIRITDLFRPIPIRRQTALKHSHKCLAKIKHTLQAYALARPQIRFSLRVLKAKSDKSNWMYAPQSNGNIKDAIFKVMGKDCATECTQVTASYEGFEISSLIPKPDADPSKISNKGSFVSIDSRPVSVSKGLLNQLVKIFKQKLRGSNSRLADVKDPFIWMNITCPQGSYDANVEPAKDDVVFEDGEKVLIAARKLLDLVYFQTDPALDEDHANQRNSHSTGLRIYEDGSTNAQTNDVGAQHAAKRRRLESLRILPQCHPALSSSSPSPTQPQQDQQSIINIDDDENQENENETLQLNDITISNPWTIAKMTASIKRPLPQALSHRPNPPSILSELTAPQLNSRGTRAAPKTRHLPTPDNSSSPIRAMLASRAALPLTYPRSSFPGQRFDDDEDDDDDGEEQEDQPTPRHRSIRRTAPQQQQHRGLTRRNARQMSVHSSPQLLTTTSTTTAEEGIYSASDAPTLPPPTNTHALSLRVRTSREDLASLAEQLAEHACSSACVYHDLLPYEVATPHFSSLPLMGGGEVSANEDEDEDGFEDGEESEMGMSSLWDPAPTREEVERWKRAIEEALRVRGMIVDGALELD